MESLVFEEVDNIDQHLRPVFSVLCPSHPALAVSCCCFVGIIV